MAPAATARSVRNRPLSFYVRLIRPSWWARMGLTVAVAAALVGPAYAAPTTEREISLSGASSVPSSATPALPRVSTNSNSPSAVISNPVATSTTTTTKGTGALPVDSNPPSHPGPVAIAVDPPNQYAAPTLTILRVQPSPAVEGQPLQVSFQLTNNSSTWPLSGAVRLTGISGEAFGGGQGIDHLAPGTTLSGVAQDTAPAAAKGLPIGVALQGMFDDNAGGENLGGGVACSNCGGTATSAAASTSVDIQGVYYIELDSFHPDVIRSNCPGCSSDTDYVSLTARQEPSVQSASAISFGAITVRGGNTYTPLAGGPLVIGPFYALPDDSNLLVFNYAIVNSGHNSGEDILNAMVQAGLQAAGAAAGSEGGAGGAAAGQGLASLLASLTGAFFANCDGVVVADQSVPLSGGLLASMTASGPHSETNDDPGSNSASFCGQNSHYHSTWHISRDNP